MRLGRLILLLGVCLQGWQCGEPAPDAGLILPWEGRLTACENTLARSRLSSMQAELLIGGFLDEPCPLTVDPGTLEISGTCNGILADITRYLLLVYHLPNPALATDQEQLAFVAGFATLGDDASDEVAVDLNNSDHARFVFEQAIFDAWPETDVSENLGAAEAWSVSLTGPVVTNNYALDRDRDGVSNLQEACEGTLF